MKVLLVEPNYDAKFKPLGLMRISSYHKAKKDKVKFIKGNKKINFKPDKIYITSLFTYRYKETLKTVKYYRDNYPKSDIMVGGILASLRPDLFRKEGVKVHVGLLKKVENFPPDYDLFPDIDYSLTFTSRGCVNKCPFCVVPKIEGKIYSRDWLKDINLKFKKIIFMDNNWLAKEKKDWLNDVKLLRELHKKGITEIDFNQSLDCRLFTEDVAKTLKGLPIKPMRFSFDHMGQDKFAQNAIRLSLKYGFKKVHLDVLYNWNDTPEDFYYRIKEISRFVATAIPMRYTPIDYIDKSYVGKHWTKKERDAVDRLNPYQHGQVSAKGVMSEFEYFFGKNAKEFRKLLNYKDIGKLSKLKMRKFTREKI